MCRNDGTNPMGIVIAREGPASYSDPILVAWKVVFHEVGDVLSADHLRFDPFRPYIP